MSVCLLCVQTGQQASGAASGAGASAGAMPGGGIIYTADL